jgi:hypothetical protein
LGPEENKNGARPLKAPSRNGGKLMTGEFGPPGEESPLTAGASSSISVLLSIELCESSPQLKHQKV